MDAVKFIEERNRMCNSFSPDCEGCRVDEAKPVMDECCRWMFENPEKPSRSSRNGLPHIRARHGRTCF